MTKEVKDAIGVLATDLLKRMNDSILESYFSGKSETNITINGYDKVLYLDLGLYFTLGRSGYDTSFVTYGTIEGIEEHLNIRWTGEPEDLFEGIKK